LVQQITLTAATESFTQSPQIPIEELQSKPAAEVSNSQNKSSENPVNQLVSAATGRLRENIILRRGHRYSSPGLFGIYVHGSGPERTIGVGRIGGMVACSSPGSGEWTPEHRKLVKWIAQMITGYHPANQEELLKLPFVFDSAFCGGQIEPTVQYVLDQAQLQVQDFVRYQVGEELL
jgi:translation elongation factor EF-Ts